MVNVRFKPLYFIFLKLKEPFSNSNVGYLCFGVIEKGGKQYSRLILGYVLATKKWFVYHDGSLTLNGVQAFVQETFKVAGKTYVNVNSQIYKIQ